MWQWSRLSGLLTVAAALVVVASAQGARPLQQRTLLASDLPGFKVDIPPEIFRSTAAWLKVKGSGQYKESAALHARGFVAGAREHLYLTRGGLYAADATSSVIEFKSPQGALVTLSKATPSFHVSGARPFTVPGIPGALAAATTSVNSNGFSWRNARARCRSFL